jgi:serine/threonine-protein kinase
MRIAIPDVTGQSQRAAELNIRRRGLDVDSTAEIPLQGSADRVLAQSPPANASQVAAPKISLLVAVTADPQAFMMPNFVGQPLGSASRTLQDAGFKLGNVSIAAPPANPPSPPIELITPVAPIAAPPQPSPASIIVSQTPVSGQKVVIGALVSFEVR